MNSLKNEQLIDVRTPEEFASGHLQNAVNINFYSSDFKEQLEKLDKTKPVMVYCKSGGRSGKAAIILKELGFTIVYNLADGVEGWKNKQLPVVK
ncbi:MAG: rhodanese-like domain-containing protein [Chitinophagales bacterium]|nr:rhodanese-like domain-containing protein [Chitinophagales bacterium]